MLIIDQLFRLVIAVSSPQEIEEAIQQFLPTKEDVRNKRRMHLDFKALVMDPSARIYLQNWSDIGGYGMFNELRISLPNRVLGGGFATGHSIIACSFPHLSTPKLIEELHPSKCFK